MRALTCLCSLSLLIPLTASADPAATDDFPVATPPISEAPIPPVSSPEEAAPAPIAEAPPAVPEVPVATAPAAIPVEMPARAPVAESAPAAVQEPPPVEVAAVPVAVPEPPAPVAEPVAPTVAAPVAPPPTVAAAEPPAAAVPEAEATPVPDDDAGRNALRWLGAIPGKIGHGIGVVVRKITPHKRSAGGEPAQEASVTVIVAEAPAPEPAPAPPPPPARRADGYDENGRPLAIPGHTPPPPGYNREVEPAPAPVVEAEPERPHYGQSVVWHKRRPFGPYIGGSFATNSFTGRGPVADGLEAGFFINRTLQVGAGVYGGAAVADEGFSAILSYGGIQPGIAMFPRHRLHARADALIGMGSWAPAWNHQNQVHIDFFGVVEPRVALEFRVTRAIQVAGFAAYRMPFGGGELARELRGPELGLNVRLGWF